MAASAEEAIDIWYSDVDPEIDKPKLGWNVGTHPPPPSAIERSGGFQYEIARED
jgi:hypothetical protein